MTRRVAACAAASLIGVAGCVGVQMSSTNSLTDGTSSPRSSTAVLTPAGTPAPDIVDLPSPGGTCIATQIAALPIATYGPGFSTFGTADSFATVQLLNVGDRSCVLRLPETVGVASATGPIVAVEAADTGTETPSGENTPVEAATIPSSGSLSVVIGASWAIPPSSFDPTGLPALPCDRPVRQVERLEFPLASGTVEIGLPLVVPTVCTSPASISLGIKAAAPSSSASPAPTRHVTLPPDSAGCPITAPRRAPSELDMFGAAVADGNVYLWVGGLGDGGVIEADARFVQPDGSIGWKLGWYRITPGTLTISGTRLDAPAPPLGSSVPNGYGPQGFQASGVVFPTPGCWQVTGTVAGNRLTFVTYVDEPKTP